MVEIYYETWGVHWCNKKICDLEYEWVDFLTYKNAKNASRRVLLAAFFLMSCALSVPETPDITKLTMNKVRQRPSKVLISVRKHTPNSNTVQHSRVQT